jgi:hypothetical protein
MHVLQATPVDPDRLDGPSSRTSKRRRSATRVSLFQTPVAPRACVSAFRAASTQVKQMALSVSIGWRVT